MQKRFVLCGPQGVGKSHHSAEIAAALKCETIIDDWRGNCEIGDSTLAITNEDYVMPEGGVCFHVEDAAGLRQLIATLSA